MKKILRFAAAALLAGLLSACAQSGAGMSSAAAGSSMGMSSSAGSGMTSSSAAVSSAAKNSDGYTVINAAAAKVMIDAGGVVIVDVRTAAEYGAAHIPGAINVPVESIGSLKPAALPDTGAVLLVYCRTGIRAATASARLAKIGYTNVYDMGGIVDWPYEKVSG